MMNSTRSICTTRQAAARRRWRDSAGTMRSATAQKQPDPTPQSRVVPRTESLDETELFGGVDQPVAQPARRGAPHEQAIARRGAGLVDDDRQRREQGLGAAP